MPSIEFKIVEVVVFRIRAVPQFLVLHRSEVDPIYPGLWQLVSGGIEPGEKAYEAACREVEEETGVAPESIYNTPLTNVFYFYTSDCVNVSPVFAAKLPGDAEIQLSSEHQDYRWLSVDDAISQLVWPGQKDAVRKVLNYIIHENPSGQFMEIRELRKSERRKLRPGDAKN